MNKDMLCREEQPAAPKVYILENEYMKIAVTNAGAAIKEINPKKDGRLLGNITMGLSDLSLYDSDSTYSGAVLGPAAGRIAHGRLDINGRRYQLSLNDGGIHHIHGGFRCLSRMLWMAESHTDTELCLRASLPDGEEGYPGNRSFTACYRLIDDRLYLKLSAISDRDTFFFFSSHTYFDLDCFQCSGLLQKLCVNADKVIYNTSEHIPESLASVCGTAFDFRKPACLMKQLEKYRGCRQTEFARGYNHAFILNKSCCPGAGAAESINSCSDTGITESIGPCPDTGINESLSSAARPAAELCSHDDAIRLHLYTDAPCLVVYSGGFIDKGLPLGPGLETSESCAIALEAQDIPDAPNQHFMPYHITRAGDVYERNIMYEIIV